MLSIIRPIHNPFKPSFEGPEFLVLEQLPNRISLHLRSTQTGLLMAHSPYLDTNRTTFGPPSLPRHKQITFISRICK